MTHFTFREPPDALTADDVRGCIARIDQAKQVVGELCDGTRNWTMCIPARPDEDPDLVIGAALAGARVIMVQVLKGLHKGADR